MTLNGVKRNTEKKNQHIIVNAIQISIQFFYYYSEKSIVKKVDLIKNDDIKPD